MSIPAVVRDVELTEPLPFLPAEREGMRVGRAWLLVRYCTQPLGFAQADIPPDGLSPDQCGQAIAAALGPTIAQHLGPADGEAAAPTAVPAAIPASVPASGLPMPRPCDYLDERRRALEQAPPITVAVCTRNRPQSLRRLLDSVLAPAYPALRVLVVDSGPTDERTRQVAAEAAHRADVEYLRVARPGLAIARNAAVRARPDDTIAWVDDDVEVDRYWLAEAARAVLVDADADVICGSVVPAELESPAQVWFEEFGGLVKGRGFGSADFSPSTRDRHNPLFPLPPFGAGANMITRPGVVASVGYFDEALGAGTPAMGGEDTLFLTQVLLTGATVAYRPSVLVRHYHRRELDELRQQLVGYGTGLTASYAALVRRRPSVVPGLVTMVPRALRELIGPGGARTATIGAEFPVALLEANRRAMLRGPVAYLRGRRSA